MNEVIEQMLKECYIPLINRNDDSEYDMYKFAQLIVQKCCDAADMAHNAGCDSVGDYVGESLGYGRETGISNWRTTSDVEPAVQSIKPSPPPSRVIKEYRWREK